jgi:hypothetical protein
MNKPPQKASSFTEIVVGWQTMFAAGRRSTLENVLYRIVEKGWYEIITPEYLSWRSVERTAPHMYGLARAHCDINLHPTMLASAPPRVEFLKDDLVSPIAHLFLSCGPHRRRFVRSLSLIRKPNGHFRSVLALSSTA